MKQMHISKMQLIFTSYNITEPVEDFTIQSETYIFSGKRWFGIYVYHIPSERTSSKAIVPYRDINIEDLVSQLVYESMPRDDAVYLDRFDRYFSEDIIPPV